MKLLLPADHHLEIINMSKIKHRCLNPSCGHEQDIELNHLAHTCPICEFHPKPGELASPYAWFMEPVDPDEDVVDLEKVQEAIDYITRGRGLKG